MNPFTNQATDVLVSRTTVCSGKAPQSRGSGGGIPGSLRWFVAGLCGLLLASCERPPMDSQQLGFRGTGMVEINNPRLMQKAAVLHQVPEELPAVSSEGPKASSVYQNVQVLGDLSVAEFTRLMAAITLWVSPEKGCNYCHAGGNFASDDLYTKLVARRMIQMTTHINSTWKAHVAETGVTCYTCHRGQPVPKYLWFEQPAPKQGGAMGWRNAQNTPSPTVGLSSLPYDPYKIYFLDKQPIRVQSGAALPDGTDRALRPVETLQYTESNYALMMHFSGSLGVNCTYCHNSQNFASWSGSRPQRVTAWHGIQMVRDLNLSYLEPLRGTYPPEDLGPLGDAPKAFCATCHQGLNKPLGGVSMLKAHPELAAPGPSAPKDMVDPAKAGPAPGKDDAAPVKSGSASEPTQGAAPVKSSSASEPTQGAAPLRSGATAVKNVTHSSKEG